MRFPGLSLCGQGEVVLPVKIRNILQNSGIIATLLLLKMNLSQYEKASLFLA